jgi:predicted Zn-dependent peptidase
MKRHLITLLFGILLSNSFALDIQIPVHYDTLKNGLRVIIVPDTNVAVVSCRLYYFVGSMYEGPGTTGLSHMYEHMMFKGTKTLGTKNYYKEVPIMKSIDSIEHLVTLELAKGKSESDSSVQKLQAQILQLTEKQRKFIKKDEIWELYQNNGGTELNAWTGDDMTAYIVTLPKNKINLFYWIESDRMRSPVLREFYSERDVVTEERRMRVDNKPLNNYYERLNAIFYVAHPYRLPTIGWMSDIRSYTREKLEQHVHKFYTPDNAVLILVGNIDPKKSLKAITQYFGPIPRASQPKAEVVTREPEPIGATRFTVHDNANPRIDLLFHTPGYPNPDLYRLDVIEGLFSGQTGRLYQRLVNETGLCTDAGAGNDTRLQNGDFSLWAVMKNETNPETVEKIILEEIAKVSSEPPKKSEMERISNEIRMSFVTGLNSLEGLSDRLASYERMGSWKDMLTYPEKIAAVKPEEIPAIAKKYLDPSKMTLGELLSPEKQSSSQTTNAK